MVKYLPLLSLLFFTLSLQAQNDSIPRPKSPTKKERIASARKELLASFLADDPAGASLWRDSLMRLEDSTRAALVWDERWLLYYWEEAYGNLFDEVVRLDQAERQRLADKIPPPKDSLFEWLDYSLYEARFQVYDKIGRGFLTEEEKLFALIEFDYLLRLNEAEKASGDWNERLDAFVKLYPNSRFNNYIRENLYFQKPKSASKKKQGGGLDLLFFSGRWRGYELERTLQSPYGFDIGMTYWLKRWNFSLRSVFAWQNLAHSIYEDGYEWPAGEQSVFISPSLEIGYDVVNTLKFRCFPSVGAGISILKPPSPSEEDDTPQPDYYSNFNYTKGYLGVALTADVKIKSFESNELGLDAQGNSYLAARIRLGYNWLNWGDNNEALRGDMFFFAIGINLFGHSFE
jgi:hypothetical protein